MDCEIKLQKSHQSQSKENHEKKKFHEKNMSCERALKF